MNTPDPVGPQVAAAPESSQQSNPKFYRNRKIFFGLAILAALIIFAVGYYPHLTLKSIDGTRQCVSWVKKIEGKNFSGVYSLQCTIKSARIANSNIKAYKLNYSGTPKDKGVCLDPGISSPPPENSQYCIGWAGVVMDNGKTYVNRGIETIANPVDFDECYSSNLNATSDTHDLYFYNNELYDRDIYKNKVVKTAFGTCTLNGTTIYAPVTSDAGNTHYITNVKVTYSEYPSDCYTVLIGKDIKDWQDCINFVTAANLNLFSCHPDKEAVFTDGKITSFKTERQLYFGQTTEGNCVEVYTARLADLGQCATEANIDIKTKCQQLVANPAWNITRVSTNI